MEQLQPRSIPSSSPPPGPPQTVHWYLLRTHARKEAQVDRYLREKRVETYLPLKGVAIRHGRPIHEPFFPSYLFFRFPVESPEWAVVRWAPGSSNVVSFGGEPAIVPQLLIDDIRRRLRTFEERIRSGVFTRGDRIKVVWGPLSGLEAIFDESVTGASRALILIDILGRLVRAQVPIDQLRRC